MSRDVHAQVIDLRVRVIAIIRTHIHILCTVKICETREIAKVFGYVGLPIIPIIEHFHGPYAKRAGTAKSTGSVQSAPRPALYGQTRIRTTAAHARVRCIMCAYGSRAVPCQFAKYTSRLTYCA